MDPDDIVEFETEKGGRNKTPLEVVKEKEKSVGKGQARRSGSTNWGLTTKDRKRMKTGISLDFSMYKQESRVDLNKTLNVSSIMTHSKLVPEKRKTRVK